MHCAGNRLTYFGKYFKVLLCLCAKTFRWWKRIPQSKSVRHRSWTRCLQLRSILQQWPLLFQTPALVAWLSSLLARSIDRLDNMSNFRIRLWNAQSLPVMLSTLVPVASTCSESADKAFRSTISRDSILVWLPQAGTGTNLPLLLQWKL